MNLQDGPGPVDLDIDQIRNGYFETRDYLYHYFVEYCDDWPAAEAIAREEAEALEGLLESHVSPVGLEVQLADLEFEDFESDVVGLDLGVRGACVSLCAAGIATTSSCRGHVEREPSHPQIHFFTGTPRLELVSKLAAMSGVRLDSSQTDGTWAWSEDLSSMIDLGNRIRSSRSDFGSLTPTPAMEFVRAARRSPEMWKQLERDAE